MIKMLMYLLILKQKLLYSYISFSSSRKFQPQNFSSQTHKKATINR